MRRALAKPAMMVLGAAVSVLFGWLALRKISLQDVGDSLSGADYGWLVPCLVLTLLAGYVRAFRWRILFLDPGRLSTAQCFGALSVGLMFNNLLPSRAGEVPRLLVLRSATRIPASEIGTTMVVERVLDVFTLALIGCVLWPFFPDRAWIHGLGVVCAALVTACVLFVGAAARFSGGLRRILARLLGLLPRLSTARADSLVEGVVAGSAILRRPRRLAEACALSLAVWLATGLAGLALFPAFGLDVNGLAPWLLLVANSFALTIPSGPATIGVYEASVQASLVAFGVSRSDALSYALTLHAVNFLPVILIGLIASWAMGARPAARRAIAKRA
jgi:hypothetical protein